MKKHVYWSKNFTFPHIYHQKRYPESGSKGSKKRINADPDPHACTTLIKIEKNRLFSKSLKTYKETESSPFYIKPCSVEISSIIVFALLYNSSVRDSIIKLPPHGSATSVIPVSSCKMSCVFLAIRADCSVGSPIMINQCDNHNR